ncbi:hypothetical protein KKA09_04350, partial [Patescibacteria group bacterium]|nr:hypothetical protein [Patescibacteria group bacterium]
PMVFDVWFGTETLTQIAQGLTVSHYPLSGLKGSTTYKWRVKATDTRGSSTMSGTWTFTTIASPPIPQLTKIELALGTTTLIVSATTIAIVTAYYDNDTTIDVTAESEIASSESQVVSVLGNMLSAIGTGTSVITATYGSFIASQTVTVVPLPPLIPLYGLAYGGRYQTEPGVGIVDFSGVFYDPTTRVLSGMAYSAKLGSISFNEADIQNPPHWGTATGEVVLPQIRENGKLLGWAKILNYPTEGWLCLSSDTYGSQYVKFYTSYDAETKKFDLWAWCNWKEGNDGGAYLNWGQYYGSQYGVYMGTSP